MDDEDRNRGERERERLTKSMISMNDEENLVAMNIDAKRPIEKKAQKVAVK